MTPVVKRYILSSVITFASTFFLFLGTDIGQIANPSVLTYSFVLGLVTVAGRAAFKAVIEAIAGGHADLPSLTPPTPPAAQ